MNTKMMTLADGIEQLRRAGSKDPASGSSASPDAKEIRALAAQFESLLIGTMLKEMREASDDQSRTASENAPLFGSIDTELALALSRAGGFGLAENLKAAFARQTAPQSTHAPELAVTTDLPVVAPMTLPIAAQRDFDYSAPSGRVSSAFGWRKDPIRGEAAFHHGTDIAMPVGQEVRVAAAGRVTFAGSQGGYGLTVVVQHADGLETRYAHLSAVLVEAGDQVSKGQAVAKSGNTGKSTGPHLHFEVRRNGQSVDPASLQ